MDTADTIAKIKKDVAVENVAAKEAPGAVAAEEPTLLLAKSSSSFLNKVVDYLSPRRPEPDPETEGLETAETDAPGALVPVEAESAAEAVPPV